MAFSSIIIECIEFAFGENPLSDGISGEVSRCYPVFFEGTEIESFWFPIILFLIIEEIWFWVLHSGFGFEVYFLAFEESWDYFVNSYLDYKSVWFVVLIFDSEYVKMLSSVGIDEFEVMLRDGCWNLAILIKFMSFWYDSKSYGFLVLEFEIAYSRLMSEGDGRDAKLFLKPVIADLATDVSLSLIVCILSKDSFLTAC